MKLSQAHTRPPMRQCDPNSQKIGEQFTVDSSSLSCLFAHLSGLARTNEAFLGVRQKSKNISLRLRPIRDTFSMLDNAWDIQRNMRQQHSRFPPNFSCLSLSPAPRGASGFKSQHEWRRLGRRGTRANNLSLRPGPAMGKERGGNADMREGGGGKRNRRRCA